MEKKSKNSKPILSILIDEDKRSRFSELARQNNLSMGWLVNQAIDKMLESGSINIYMSSIIPTENIAATSVELSADDIDTLAKEAIEKYSVEIFDVEVMLMNSIGIVNTELEALKKRLGLSEELVANQAEELEQLKKPLAVG